MLLGLGGVTALFVVIAPWVMAIFHYGPGDQYGRSPPTSRRILFPIVLVLGLTGIVVGILNSYDHFTIPALAPIAWNLVILLGLGLGVQNSDLQSTRLYYYAVAILVATIVQFLLPLPWLRGRDDRLRMVIDIRDPAVKRVFVLMLPVTIGLGLININAVIDQLFATNLLDPTLAPAAIVRAFRLYMLPQGMFSVAVATVLFPLLSRHAAREDWDAFKSTVAIGLAPHLLPSPAGERGGGHARDADRAAALPARRVHGEPDDIVAPCLAAFALGLTFNGTMLMLNRGFFALQSAVDPDHRRTHEPRGQRGDRRRLLPLRDLGDPALDLAREHRRDVGAARVLPAARRRLRDDGDGAELRARRRRVGRARRGRLVGVAPPRLGVRAVADGADRLPRRGPLLGYAAFFGACRLLGVRELETISRLRRRAA